MRVCKIQRRQAADVHSFGELRSQRLDILVLEEAKVIFPAVLELKESAVH